MHNARILKLTFLGTGNHGVHVSDVRLYRNSGHAVRGEPATDCFTLQLLCSPRIPWYVGPSTAGDASLTKISRAAELQMACSPGGTFLYRD